MDLARVKDESGRTIALLPPSTIAALNLRFEAITSQLLAAPAKAEALRKALALQLRMKNSVQTRADFADTAALFGYAHYKFRLRGLTAYALFASAAAAHPSLRAALVGSRERGPPAIASVGGGPGNDAFGAMLWVREYGHGGMAAAYAVGEGEGEPPLLQVYDCAPGWGTVVARVAELGGLRIGFDVCDVCDPLSSAPNSALLSSVGGAPALAPDVVVFCYVLNEVMNTCVEAAAAAAAASGSSAEVAVAAEAPSWLRFVDDVWRAAKPGTVFLFRDQHERAERALVAHFSSEWREGENYWWIGGEGAGAGEGEGDAAARPAKKQKSKQKQARQQQAKQKQAKHAPPPRALAALKPA